MNKSEIYKSYQVFNFLIERFSYITFTFYSRNNENELWLANKENKDYQLIRISNNSSHINQEDYAKINAIKNAIKKQLFIDEINFLDIHICKEEVFGDNDMIACMDKDFKSGIDLTNIYPGIYEAIKEVEDQESEIKRLITRINNSLTQIKKREKQKPFIKRLKDYPKLVISILISISILMFILTTIMSTKYSTSASLIFLGADYKMFTLGLGQYWRLLTYSFLHSSFMHLFTNCFSLYVIGTLLEGRIGHLKFILIYITGVLAGALTNGALTGNGIVVGMSGGIYALFAFFILYFMNKGLLNITSLMPTIFINIFINFLPNVSWQGHLGGALMGVVFFYIFKEDKTNFFYVPLIFIILISLFVKYQKDFYVKPFYGGTDMEVLKIMSDLNMEDSAQKLNIELYNIYIGY